jgi:HAD superfamily hydrolase (TIGR01509 family)
VPSAVIVDVGGVMTRYQPEEEARAIAAAAARIGTVAPALALERYWQERLRYDRGDLDEAGYWSLVTGTALEATDPRLDDLVALDVRSWSHVRPESVAAVAELAARSVPLALLSNTPAPHARWMLEQPWSRRFAVHVFSYALREIKPEPAVFRHTVAALGCEPGDALLVDDRADNVAGARAAGLAGILFTGPETWTRVLASVTR